MRHCAGGGCDTLGGRTLWDIGMEDTVRHCAGEVVRHWEGGHCGTLGWRTLRDIGREDTVRYCDGGHCEILGCRIL